MSSCCQIGQIRPSNKNLRSSTSEAASARSPGGENQTTARPPPGPAIVGLRTAQRSSARYRVGFKAPGTPLLHPITPSPRELGKCCVLVAGRIIATSNRNKSHPALAASQYFRSPYRLVPVLPSPVHGLLLHTPFCTGSLPYPRLHLRRPRLPLRQRPHSTSSSLVEPCPLLVEHNTCFRTYLMGLVLHF